jgi:hypothetical protein
MPGGNLVSNQTPTLLTGSTEASNAASVSVNYLRYVGNYPIWPALWLIVATVSAALAVTVHWYALGGLVVALIGLFLHWLKARIRFKHGDANPGVIISEKPLLLAVIGDLSTGGAPWPVIKILRVSPRQLAPLASTRGVKVPTAAVYSPPSNKDDTRWSDFDPVPLTCATDRHEDIQRAINSFTKEEWQVLAAGLKRLPQPPTVGLHSIRN